LLAAGPIWPAGWSISQASCALVDELLPLARAGVAVVVWNPRCLLTLRERALGHGPGEGAKSLPGARCFSRIHAGELKAGRFGLKLTAPDAPILLHGHCHQKASARSMRSMDCCA